MKMEDQANSISMAAGNLSATAEELSATTETLTGNARGIRDDHRRQTWQVETGRQRSADRREADGC
ncbi:hypothetical protein A6M21_16900 [Desulfotomaculum copahuensis]|uniref:Uncharacterized protein n=1 Tax=Desulfotomaculum copahuensis TaxID=1838280 RepID=A0A1B7LIM0_9FIRM|nr:hypothetical protein A6M21_16900 [Desulfotomaculum copahuensis]